MPRNSTSVSTKQERIAALAKQSPSMAFTSLAYLMDMDWLTEAYRRTRKDGAAGVDGVTADEYEQDNLHPDALWVWAMDTCLTMKAPISQRVATDGRASARFRRLSRHGYSIHLRPATGTAAPGVPAA
jgi:hypothetical protein